jgi:hypothetical protein
MVLGPLVAAGLLKLWSWEYVVASSAALFLAADGAVMAWQRLVQPVLAEPKPVPDSWVSSLKTALRHIIQRPGLLEAVLLAAAVNLVIGVTLATSAAMVTGVHGGTDTYYALLQMAGAVATVIVLFAIAHLATALATLGIVAYVMIFIGGIMTGAASDAHVYALGFVLVVGFDRDDRHAEQPVATLGGTAGERLRGDLRRGRGHIRALACHGVPRPSCRRHMASQGHKTSRYQPTVVRASVPPGRRYLSRTIR